jgi:hypothetical protein
MLKAALHYRNKYGFSVIPCKSDKRPIVKWESFQREKPSVEQIKEWWTKYPYANIGIITGEISGIDVIDCDTEEAYQNLNENFLSDTFQTPVVKTPKAITFISNISRVYQMLCELSPEPTCELMADMLLRHPPRTGREINTHGFLGYRQKTCR